MTILLQTAYQLREYQQELLEEIFSSLARGNRRLIVQSPTGSGKTVLFSAVAEKFTRRGDGVLVLVHRLELLLQAKEKLETITGCRVGLIKSGYKTSPENSIQVASVQSLISRENWPDAGLVIVDEAHHSAAATYTKIFKSYPEAYILGVTATPARADGRGFRGIFDELITGQSVRELIETGNLCKFKLFASKKTIITTSVKTTGGDYDLKELAEAINNSLVTGDLIESWRRYALGQKTVLFAIDVKHSKAIAHAFQKAGISAEHIDGASSADERKSIVERFTTGQTLILCNCGIFSEGLDVPTIEAVQIVRPTKSLTLYMQMLGRALRPALGKKHATFIDHTNNWAVHGLPDEEREWTLDAVSLKKTNHTVECPSCSHVFVPLSHEKKPYRKEWEPKQQEYKIYSKVTCPECGIEFDFEYTEGGEPPPARELEHDTDAILEQIDLEVRSEVIKKIMQLKAEQITKKYKVGWIYPSLIKAYSDLNLGELRSLAKLLGYQPGWAWWRWCELQGEKPIKS